MQNQLQVLETAADGDRFQPARELLPWADPYIASLMGRLDGNDADATDDLDEENAWDFDSEQLDEDDDGKPANDFTPDEDDWHLDGVHALPPVYGGWPLLNDLPVESRHESV